MLTFYAVCLSVVSPVLSGLAACAAYPDDAEDPRQHMMLTQTKRHRDTAQHGLVPGVTPTRPLAEKGKLGLPGFPPPKA